MNSRQFDDLSFKFLSAIIIAGVLASFMAPSAPSALASPEVQTVAVSAPAPVAQSVAAVTAIAPALTAAAESTVPAATPTSLRHHHRRGVEKS